MINTLPILKWTGTATGVVGALLIAMNIPQSGYGFLLFLISSLSWFVAAWRMGETSLALLQFIFIAINLLGIWRWLLAA